MSTLDRAPRYRTYVLRMWEERSEEPDHSVTWRFSLEDVCTRQRHGFGNLEALVEFLHARLTDEDAARPDDHV